MAKTTIEWATDVWNPIRGCGMVSRGCEHCYAMHQAHRFTGPSQPYEGLTRLTEHGPVWTGEVRLVPELLNQPLHWKKPRRVFVNSMSDLFHEDVPASFIGKVFGVMATCSWHIFQILTKRPERMRDLLANGVIGPFKGEADQTAFELSGHPREGWSSLTWPLPNVHLGVSCEDQATADERIPFLLQTPAAVRWVSYEPALGPVDLTKLDLGIQVTNGYGPRRIYWDSLTGWERQHHVKTDKHQCSGSNPDRVLSWVVVGGESGPGARPMHPDWVRSIRDQCLATHVPFFFKQWGEWEIASAANGHTGSVMPESGKKYTWVGKNGKTYNPSAPEGQDCWSMAKVGKKKAGHLLDGWTWAEYPR